MIDVKTAVLSAQNYLTSMQELLAEPLKDLGLEEVELSEDKQTWLITLGYNRPLETTSNVLLPPGFTTHQRVYKLIKVNAETGDVEAMKIREP
jgi:hypothetical protein